VIGGFGGDRILTGEGNDIVDAGSAGDSIAAGPGDDTVHGGSGSDDISGAAGNDTIYADSGGEDIDAGEGNDLVYVNNGTAVHSVDCGPGVDTIHVNPFHRRGGLHNRRAIEKGLIRNCEAIHQTPKPHDPTKGKTKLTRNRGGRAKGTERNDTLLGSSGPDRLIGLGGNDVIWANRKPTGRSRGTDRVSAGAGEDIVYGASRGGHSIIDGGPGNDYLQGGGETATNFISGGSGIDTIRLTGHGFNRVLAGPGDDLIYAYAKDTVRIECGAGEDTVKIGYNRTVVTRHCEHVSRRYKRH
jgi:Ca2+-binding RTX toxin-like protein